MLAGILVFFVLEKLVLWRHCHVESCEAHDLRVQPNDHARSATLILIGDTIHNVVDGILGLGIASIVGVKLLAGDGGA